jgi:uncharacterized protein (DUF2336 family)
MEAALTMLLEGSRADVKRALAEAFADSDRAPRHIVLALAAEQVSIAAPLISRSPLFIDTELIELLSAGSLTLRVAIASRPKVSAALSAAIAETGSREVCLALLANAAATIEHGAYTRIAENLAIDVTVREALLARADLPPDVHQALVKGVADALGRMVVAKSWLSETRAAHVTREATERATVAIAADAAAHTLPALVEHLRASGQLTTVLVLRAVCGGNLDFFEAALSALAAVPLERVVNLVSGHRLGALRGVYASAGLPASAFDAFAAALDIWAEVAAEGDRGRHRTTGEVSDAILARYAGVAGEGTELAAMLRRIAVDQARDAAREFAHARAA